MVTVYVTGFVKSCAVPEPGLTLATVMVRLVALPLDFASETGVGQPAKTSMAKIVVIVNKAEYWIGFVRFIG